MKRLMPTLCAFSFALCFAYKCRAQVHYGLKVQVQQNNVTLRPPSADNKGIYPARTPYFSLWFAGTVRQWTVETGIGYANRMAKLGLYNSLNPTNVKGLTMSAYYVELPLAVSRAILWRKAEVGLGVISAFRLGGDWNIASKVNRPFQWDAQAVARVHLLPRLAIEGGYLYGGLNHLYRVKKYNETAFMYKLMRLGLRYRI